jgi:hypothetical protein
MKRDYLWIHGSTLMCLICCAEHQVGATTDTGHPLIVFLRECRRFRDRHIACGTGRAEKDPEERP